MERLSTGLFLLLLANSVVLGQPVHKNARLYVQDMPENLHSAIQSEIFRQRVPLKVVENPADAELIMRETSGFTGTQRHKEEIRLIIQIFNPAGTKRWPTAPGARFYWIEQASAGWQREIAKRVVKRPSGGVQRYPSTASATDDWWPRWSREKREARARLDEIENSSGHSARAFQESAFRVPPSEIDVDWEGRDSAQVGIRFDEPPPEIHAAMTEQQVRDLFGDPVKIARLEDKSIYQYQDMVVEFRAGKVSEVKFR